MQKHTKVNYTICLIRIIACILIVFTHISNNMLDGKGNRLLWASIGVQIFFFMSGYLYSGQVISDRKLWLKKNIYKILKPYYLYLLIMIPVIALIASEEISIVKSLVAFFCLQGFGIYIEGLGQHWFITYILICYVITIFVLNRLHFSHEDDNLNGKGYATWFLLGVAFIIGQLVTIPLALLISFKVAYIFTFITGYIYGIRFKNGDNLKEKRIIDFVFYIISLLGLLIRIYLDNVALAGIYGKIASLCIQWIKLFQGGAIYIAFINLIPSNKWCNVEDNIKKKIYRISSWTFEIYIVHEFFTCSMFTRYLGTEKKLQIIIVLFVIGIVTCCLILLEKLVDIILGRISRE